ncbi:MAG: hypothetical protein JKY70_18985 [Mucilaginibacter sp.]|nr:hypothetical protein [Mucilaginibacter sp.]
MKLNFYKLTLLGLLITIASCKKNDQLNAPVMDPDARLTAAAGADHLPLTVVTIAGKYNTQGYVDGPGDQARFTGTSGLELMTDGSLLIADTYNNKIRKITNEGVVSTVSIPKNNLGESLSQPNFILTQQDGTMNILAGASNYQGSNNKFWIIKPDANTSITPARRSTNDFYRVLAKDPYNSYLFMGGQENKFDSNGNDFQRAFIEKFLPGTGNTYGTDIMYLPASVPANIPEVTSLYCGYNAVKYIVIHSNILYKLTPAGVYQALYTANPAVSISDVIATKDSQTLYIAEGGAIKAISKGRVQFIVGPHKELKGRDGVGSNADVYAFKLALSKDESILYFTDGNTTVRKLYLL